MEREIYIDFELLNTKMPPKEITKKIGVIPNLELLRGENRPELDIPRQNIWSIKSSIYSMDIIDHWNEIESKLIHAKADLKLISKDGLARVTIVVQTEMYIPKIIIPVTMTSFLADIGAIVDIDHI